MRFLSLSLVWFFLICGLSVTGDAYAHSVHVSTAEVEHNVKTQKLEISLTVFMDDFELALMRHSERLLSFDKTPAAELDGQIQSYLEKTFVVTECTGRPAKIHWVGREMETAKTDAPTVTLFFEVPLTACLSGVSLDHSMFCELFKDQINLLHLRSDGREVELLFSKAVTSLKLAVAE